ncbi:hypothetical protein CKAH01_08825 [Colletotrichum kahawae]|uniref:Uncharacterized protein n=1 Tax=Colletotrichum kahawae TaxID=34407 RepID=A0AAE0CZP8_COLKA|nr:hypothetical protein CKAH01_08825 [Colletotrichum kahawae]
MALSIMPSNKELAELVTEVIKDINLSLKQTGSIPETLSSGPWTINYLNQLRLLAYSPHVQRVTLKPKDGEKFKHFEHHDLSTAIVQVVNHATKAFHVADSNMNLVQMQAKALFGKTGLAQDILMNLQTPDGGQIAMCALGGLKDGMSRCSSFMDKVCTAFGEVIETGEELELALTNEASDSQKMKDRLELDQCEREAEKAIETSLLQQQKEQLEKGEESLKKAQKKLKDLGIKTLSDVQGIFSGTLGAAINIIKETPNIALTGLKSVGNLGNILSRGDRDFDPKSSNPDEKPLTSIADPALQSASEIESQLSRLQIISEENLLEVLQSGEIGELQDCVAQMRAMNASLGDGPYSQIAMGILKKGITFGEVVLALQPKASSIDPEGQEWKERVRKWQMLFENVQAALLQLRSAAVSQTAMRNAEGNVRRITLQNTKTQTRIIQLAHQMKQLDHSKVKLEDTKKVLLEAIQVLYEIKKGFNIIKRKFDFLAGYVEIRINDGVAKRLTYAMEAAKGRVSDGDMLCYQIQARTIVDMVLQTRGHFLFINDMAKLYSQISKDYILPCIKQMGSLKVGKTATSNEQEAEKACIDKFTTDCSQAIIKIAEAEMEKFQEEMTARCMEIREDARLQGLDKKVSQAHRAAVEVAMSQASDRILKQETSRIEVLEKKIEKSSATIIDDELF